jgi:ABC-type multidrug transport system fused ATPase/permease subunit
MKMRMLGLAFAVCMLVMVSSAQSVSILTSIFMFESGSNQRLFLNDTEPMNLDAVVFHQYAKTWYLFFRHNDADVLPYDNISISVECNGATSPVVFPTDFYGEWNSVGELTLSFDFYENSLAIPYNSHLIYGDLSSCELFADSISFDNNSAYDYIEVETIPLVSVLENYDCSRVESTTINLATSMTFFFGVMGDMWTISWYVYSMALIIFAVFGIPMFVFIILRYAIFKITGVKLVERRA